jgi:hypothetical protein
MKKALMLAGLVLCVANAYAAETRDNQAAEGKKRNEEAYERTLEQTGWKNEKMSQEQKTDSVRPGAKNPQPSQPQSS